MPVLRGESHCEWLLAVPGLILVLKPTACGSPRPEICLSSPPLHFLWKPSICGERLFPAFYFCRKEGIAMCQDSPTPSSPVLPWPGKISQSFMVPYWEGAAHTGREKRGMKVDAAEGLRAQGCHWDQTEQHGTTVSLPKVLGVTLGISWRASLHSYDLPLGSCGQPVWHTSVYVTVLGSRDVGGCRTELQASAAVGWAKRESGKEVPANTTLHALSVWGLGISP